MKMLRAAILVAALLAVSVTAVPGVLDLTNRPFYDDVVDPKKNRATIVFWHTASCYSCQLLEPVFASVVKKFRKLGRSKDVLVTRVDAGAFPAWAQEKDIKKFPTVFVHAPRHGLTGKLFKGSIEVEDLVDAVQAELDFMTKNGDL